MSSYEISKSSLLSLKAEIQRKQQDLIKARANNEVKIKILKKNTPLEIKNKGIEARQRNDVIEEDQDLLKQSKSALEAKSKLYDKLSSGKLTKAEQEINKRFLVRFDKKNLSNRSLSPINFEDAEPDKYPESEDDRYHSDEDEFKEPGDKWVDYTDCLGRTRKCLQQDLEYLKEKDEELKKNVEAKNEDKSTKEESENTDGKDEVADKTSPEDSKNSSDKAKESELLSSDMRRELLRQQWEKEEEELRDKSDIHYQDILFGEARTHGVGYYGFSKDEEERAKQQRALKQLRDETEAKQKRAQELKVLREKQLAARIKAAKDRKRARLGLPPEEEVAEPAVQQPEISEEEKQRQENVKKQEEEKQRLLEEARKKHLRPWDVGKEGVKEHYEMTQEEWVDKKRSERTEEFAPPKLYNERKFRSAMEKSSDLDTDKSLRFTTKKALGKNRKERRRRQDSSTAKGNLCEELEFEDRLLAAYSNSMHDEQDDEYADANRGKGVEIAPPPTFDYYGPSDKKKTKRTDRAVDIQSSIDAGLQFLRKQVEDKEKVTRHRSDYTSPF